MRRNDNELAKMRRAGKVVAEMHEATAPPPSPGSPPPTWTWSPVRSSSVAAPPRISWGTTASRPSSAPRPTP